MTDDDWNELARRAERIAANMFSNAIARYGSARINSGDIAGSAVTKLWLRRRTDPTFDPRAHLVRYVRFAGLDGVKEARKWPSPMPLPPWLDDIPEEPAADARTVDLDALEATINAYRDKAAWAAGTHDDRAAFARRVGDVAREVRRRCGADPGYLVLLAQEPRLEVWRAMQAVVPELAGCSPDAIPSDQNRRRTYRVIAEVLRLIGLSQGYGPALKLSPDPPIRLVRSG